jgi:hypothetical protein
MLTDELHLAPGQGQAMVKTARLLAHTFPATAQALQEGAISYPHAAAITRAARKLPADRLPAAEPVLLEVAAAGSAAMVRAASTGWLNYSNPNTTTSTTRTCAPTATSTSRPPWTAGGPSTGTCPPRSGNASTPPWKNSPPLTDPTDTRTAPQRRADAIAEIADAAVDGQTTGITAVTITADADHLNGIGATFDDTGMPVGLSTYDLAVCQSRLTLVVSEKAGIRWSPLAVGRLNRYATPAQRAALHHRDHGCIYRGCTRPARRCHAHHIIDWRDGGSTDLANMVLLCPTTTA